MLLCGVAFCEEETENTPAQQEDRAVEELDNAVRENDASELEDPKRTLRTKRQCRIVMRKKCGKKCKYVSYRPRCRRKCSYKRVYYYGTYYRRRQCKRVCSSGGRKRICKRQCRDAKQRQCRRVYRKRVCKNRCVYRKKCHKKQPPVCRRRCSKVKDYKICYPECTYKYSHVDGKIWRRRKCTTVCHQAYRIKCGRKCEKVCRRKRVCAKKCSLKTVKGRYSNVGKPFY